MRLIANFSCGAASAVATKLVISEPGANVLIVNAFVAEEHHDNRRFLAECESWFGRPVTVVRNDAHESSALEVFRRRGYMVGAKGAPCTMLLKRAMLTKFEQPGDVLVLGYDASEQERLDDFRDRYPDRPVRAPLIERGLSKDDCKAMLLNAGIELPLMYRLGYDNANCIGCVKGGLGYFRAIREDFPEQFEALAKVQDAIGEGAHFLKDRSGGKFRRISLREIPPGPVHRAEGVPQCSFFCEQAQEEYAA